MSDIRLVRCPKCNKVLPEPHVFTVYQCGGCSAMLRAKKRSSEREKMVNSDMVIGKGTEEEEGIKGIGGLLEVEGEGDTFRKGISDMSSRSPARSTLGDGDGRKSFMEEIDLAELHRVPPKSPMRDRFLNDLSSSPVMSRNVSPSPMRERGSSDLDCDGVVGSPARSRNVSRSPLRERGSRSPMSVRTRNFSRSPMNRSPARSLNGGGLGTSPLREGVVSNENAEKEQEGMRDDFDGPEEEERRDKMTVKTSFNTWLPDDNNARESDDNNARGSDDNDLGRRRKKWTDLASNDADRISEGKESHYADEHGMTSEGSVDDSFHGSTSTNGRRDRYPRSRADHVGGYVRPGATVDQWSSGSDGIGMIHRSSREGLEKRRNSTYSSRTVDRPSSYHPDPISIHGHTRHSFETTRPADVHPLERVEFIQKYKGSTEQYMPKQASEMDDKLFTSYGFNSGSGDYSDEEHLRFRRKAMQQYSPDKNMLRPSYYDHGLGLAHEMGGVYNHLPLYDEDPYAGLMGSERQTVRPQSSQYAMPGYVPRQSLEFDQDSFESYRNGMHSHHPADWHGHDQSSSLGNRMSPSVAAYQMANHSMNLQRHVPRTYDPRMSHTAPRERPLHLATHHARRVLVASLNKRLCLPISAGAPFVVCHSCFELLKLPGKFMRKQKVYRVRCGACSSIMSFDLQNRSFGILCSQKKPDLDNATSGFVQVFSEPVPRHHRDSFTATSTNLGSYDFDASGHSFQSVESKASEPSTGQRLVANPDENTRAMSPSARSAKEELVSDSASIRSSLPDSSEMPLNIRPPPGSLLQEHLDYSGGYHRAEGENARTYAWIEKQVLENDSSQVNSVVNTASASETEVHPHELLNSLSDSGEVSKEHEDRNKVTPFPKPAFWRAFGSRSGHATPGKSEVYVNGQQVPHHVVKKAEKLAGPIQPGDYWYDPKAGFWGVMGHRCLGIIPPSIQEFSFPLSENCSSGDSGVYVNGRELHKKDLDLLVGRGLPTMRDKRYIVDISGKCREEQSKDFIVDLGKLAPTIVKNKRGFGMRVPERFND